MSYLIWSHEHQAWWKPRQIGYTTDVAQAGLYSPGETFEILTKSSLGSDPDHPEEVAVDLATGICYRVEYSGNSNKIPYTMRQAAMRGERTNDS